MAERKKRNPRTKYTVVDSIHILFGVAIVGFGIFSLIKAEENPGFIPILFACITVFQVINTVYEIQHLQRGKKRYGKIILNAILTLVLLGFTSAVWVSLR